MAKILITGGTGFLGSHICENLADHEVHVTVFKGEDRWRLKEFKDIKFHEVDYKDAESLKKTFGTVQPDKIIHLASNINGRREPEMIKSMIEENVFMTLNVLLAAQKLSNLKCIIITGSVEEYGRGKVPFKEGQELDPVSPYSLTKVMNTQMSMFFNNVEKVPVIVVRPFLSYGEKQVNDQFIPFCLKSCLRGKDLNAPADVSRDLVYAGDTAAGFRAVLDDYEKLLGQAVNVGTDNSYKLLDVAEMIKEKTKSTAKINVKESQVRKAEAMDTRGSYERLHKATGWKPTHTLSQGLDKMISWYKKHEEFWKA